MTSLIDSTLTLAHTPGETLIAILLFATVAGFIAGMFFERSLNRRSRDDEK